MNKLNTALMSALLLAGFAGSMEGFIGFGVGGDRGGVGIGFGVGSGGVGFGIGVGPSYYDYYDDDYYYVGPRNYYYEPSGYWDEDGYWVDGQGYRTDHRRAVRRQVDEQRREVPAVQKK